MKVLIPSALRSYTESGWAEASGTTLADVLADLDRLYPGMRFRMIDEQNKIRRHIRFFVGGVQVRDLAQVLDPNAELIIVQALSGG
ncbi:MAG: MoaD/ThiS family protein [Betaproteobacteria bacterium]|nr:MoaD/ThiS family protein [Betaproteobacteria bacterium]